MLEEQFMGSMKAENTQHLWPCWLSWRPSSFFKGAKLLWEMGFRCQKHDNWHYIYEQPGIILYRSAETWLTMGANRVWTSSAYHHISWDLVSHHNHTHVRQCWVALSTLGEMATSRCLCWRSNWLDLQGRSCIQSKMQKWWLSHETNGWHFL